METEYPSPWTWIAKKSLAEGWYTAAFMAEHLADLECRIGGNKNTERWKDMFLFLDQTLPLLTNKPAFLIAVSRYKEFKVGCWLSGHICKDCLMGGNHKSCLTKGEAVDIWAKVLICDSGLDIDEEHIEWIVNRFRRWVR